MAMGLAVTWCDTPRRLMGRAAFRQQRPNEVRHRFSPHDHDNVKVLRLAICEMMVAGHHLLSWWRVWTSQASDLQTTLECLWKSGINTINRPSADHEKDATSSTSPCCLTTCPQENTTQMGDTEGDLVVRSALGRVSIITGPVAVMHQNTKHVLREGFWLMIGGGWRKAAVTFDLLVSHCAIMRSNSVLTPLRLPFLPFLHSYLSPTLPLPVATPLL